MTRTLLIATLAFVFEVGTLAHIGFSQDRPDPLTGVQQALNLSATQVEAVRAVLNLRMQSIQTAQENIRAKREALSAIQRQNAPNATELGNAMQALQQAQEALTAIHAKFDLDFQALLNADQKKVLADTRAAAGRIQALARLGLVGGGPEFGSGGPGGPRGIGGPGGRGGGPGGPGFGEPGPRGQRGPQ